MEGTLDVRTLTSATRDWLRSLPQPLSADDLKQTGRQDDARINVDRDHELRY